MEDIIDIYEPVYTEPALWPLMLMVLGGAAVLAVILFFVFKFIKNKKEDPDRFFNEAMKTCISLQNNLSPQMSREFSFSITKTITEFMTKTFNVNFRAMTREELLHELNSREEIMKYKDSFIIMMKYLGPAKFSRYEIPEQQMSSILTQVVETITAMHQDKKEREANV